MFKTEHSACSDIKSKPILGNTHKNMLDVKREIHEEKQDDKELEIGSSNIQTSFVVPEETSRNMESNVKETKDFDEGDGIGMKKVVAKDTVCDVKEIVDVAMETGDDEFSQGEDDIFYCDLLEARRHQDMLIKKREMDKVHPRVGRLFEMKKSSIRYQLSDLHDRLANYERPNFGVVSSTAADYKFNLADHYGQGTSHVLVGDGAYLVPDDAGLIGKQEFYRGFLTVESVDRKLISEAWVYNHYRWIVWKLAAYTLTFSSIAQRCFTPEMVMLQLKYRYDREIDRAERSSIKKIYEQDDTPGKRMVQLYLSDGWYGIPAQVDSALTRLVLAGRIFVGQKLIMARAELVGGEDASTPLEYMEKLSGGGCLFRSGSAEERARREFESRKQTEMEKLYSRLQEEMEIEDRQEKKGRGVRKFGDREVAALQTGEEIHDAIQSAAQPDTVQSYLSERQLELLYDHQRCLQDQKRADLAARAFQERQVTPMIKFRLAGCARKDMDSKTSVMLTVWRPSPEISELQEGHRYQGEAEVLTVSDITERQAAYGEVDFVGLVIRMNHASMEGERGEDVMYLADWQGRLLALHFPAGIQAGGYELPREGEVWCCSSLQSRGRLLPSSLPTLTVSQEVTTLSTRPQGGLHRRAVDKLAQATKDKTIFLEKAKADLGDFLKDSNKCYTSSKAINPIKSIEEQLREDFGETSWQIMFEGDSSFSDIGEPQGDDGKGILPTTRQVYQTDIASNEECDNVAQVSQRCSSGSEEYTPVNNQFCSTDGDDIKQKISLETAMEVASTSEQTLGFPDSTEEFQKVTKQAPDCESLETPVKTSVNKSTSVSNQNVKNQTPIDPSQVVQASKLVHPPVPLTPTSTPHPPTPSPAQRPVVRAKIARLLSYGSPAALSPLNSVVPRSVIKTFKPPAFKKI
ncbi:BRCA2-like protein [Mya arenaria]|uniref:BRCA2-like protein n=1 Tax=Mya arenaria TaxID=6604 RepID=A0ABY7DJI6_MYAAR|nr:BRCA2-like protein [Mya arenaria]